MVWVFGTNLYTSELTQKGCLQSFVAAVQPYNSLRLSNIESGLTTVVFPAPMICFTPLSAVSSFNCWKSEMATCRSCNILLSENLARSQVIRDCTAVAVEAATKSVRNTTKKREKNEMVSYITPWDKIPYLFHPHVTSLHLPPVAPRDSKTGSYAKLFCT